MFIMVYLTQLPVALLLQAALCLVASAAKNYSIDDQDELFKYSGPWQRITHNVNTTTLENLDKDGGHMMTLNTAESSATITYTFASVYFLACLWSYPVASNYAIDGNKPMRIDMQDHSPNVKKGGNGTVASHVVGKWTSNENRKHTIHITAPTDATFAVIDMFIFEVLDPPESSSSISSTSHTSSGTRTGTGTTSRTASSSSSTNSSTSHTSSSTRTSTGRVASLSSSTISSTSHTSGSTRTSTGTMSRTASSSTSTSHTSSSTRTSTSRTASSSSSTISSTSHISGSTRTSTGTTSRTASSSSSTISSTSHTSSGTGTSTGTTSRTASSSSSSYSSRITQDPTSGTASSSLSSSSSGTTQDPTYRTASSSSSSSSSGTTQVPIFGTTSLFSSSSSGTTQDPTSGTASSSSSSSSGVAQVHSSNLVREHRLAISLGVVFTSLAVVLIFLLWWWCIRRRRRNAGNMNQIMPQYNPVPTIPGYIPNDNSIWMTSDDDQSPYGLGMQNNGFNGPPNIFSHNRHSSSSRYSGLPLLTHEPERVGLMSSTAIDGRQGGNANVWDRGYPQPLRFVPIA